MTDEEVVRRYADMVYRIAIMRMKSPSETDDVFQEVFLRYIRFGRHLHGEEHIKAWLIRVTINCCNTANTNVWKKRMVPLEDRDSEPSTEMSEQGGELLETIWQLPEGDREVLYLFYYEGYSVREISKMLRKTEGAVKTKLSRARDKLRDILGKELQP